MTKQVRNQRGQSLIEYLIIVALVGVGGIAVMRAVGNNVSVQFAKVAKALGGEVQGDTKASAVTESMYQKKDLKNFLNGSLRKNETAKDVD